MGKKKTEPEQPEAEPKKARKTKTKRALSSLRRPLFSSEEAEAAPEDPPIIKECINPYARHTGTVARCWKSDCSRPQELKEIDDKYLAVEREYEKAVQDESSLLSITQSIAGGLDAKDLAIAVWTQQERAISVRRAMGLTRLGHGSAHSCQEVMHAEMQKHVVSL